MLGTVDLQIEPIRRARRTQHSAELEAGEYSVIQKVKFGGLMTDPKDSWSVELTSGELRLIVEDLRFAPEVVQTLEAKSWIDLDTSKLSVASEKILSGPARRRYSWARKLGIDAFTQEDFEGIKGISLQAVRLNEKDWSELSVLELAKRLRAYPNNPE